MKQMQAEQPWLALAIGNSRLHWALFAGGKLRSTWEIDQIPVTVLESIIEQWVAGKWPESIFPPSLVREWCQKGWGNLTNKASSWLSQLPLYIASVVPAQTGLWQLYPFTTVITPNQIPLLGLYPTLGIDRSLALLGAGTKLGWPVLAIDAGTALTLTGADANRRLVGGAILPGLGLQLRSLAQNTAALPLMEMREVLSLPPRWAQNTPEAIESGIVYTILAGIQDFIAVWQQQFPKSAIALTGGDSNTLLSYLQVHAPAVAQSTIVDPHLIFWGMYSVLVANS